MALKSPAPSVVAVALTICMLLPVAAGTAPGTYTVDPGEACDEAPCLAWDARHVSPDDRATAKHVALSPAGDVAYVLGAVFTWENSTDLTTWAVDTRTGDLLWTATYNGGSTEGPERFLDIDSITVSPDGGRVAVVGTSQGSFFERYDIVTIVYDAATGTELWSDRFNGPHSDEDTALEVVFDRSGQYVVAIGGMDGPDDGRDGIVLGYDLHTGQRLWERPFVSTCGKSELTGMDTTPSSPYIFVGGLRSTCLSDTMETPQDVDTTFTPTMWALDPASGDIVWETTDDDPLHTLQSSVFLGELEATDDHVVLASRLTNPRNSRADLDVITMSTALDGDLQWTARYDSGGRDDLIGMRAAPDGTTYLLATSPALGAAGVQDQNPDIVAWAYDADGATIWTQRLDSSTTGVEFDGATYGGEGDERLPIAKPALFASGSRLAFGYSAVIYSPVPFIGEVGEGVQVLAVLDTQDGSIAGMRSDEQTLDEFWFAAMYERQDFIAVGSRFDGFDSVASMRRYTMDITGPALDLPSDLVVEATGPDGATVSFEAEAVDDNDGPVAVHCAPASGVRFALGTTSVRCEATDSYGNTAVGSFDVDVVDTTAPILTLPEAVHAAATPDGTHVTYDASAVDVVDGDVWVACSHASGDRFALGTTVVSCSAQDAAGNAASADFEVRVTYEWSGFQAPMADGATFQQGRTVPVQVELTGDSAGIDDAEMRLWLRVDGNEFPAMAQNQIDNRLRYEDGTYQINWDTRTVMPGEYTLRLGLGDGTWNTVHVRLV